eukprot:TRINITY_DN3424_c0_g1_i1.p1 TRINITY_DN3424_c0_g1~~TRINITY_DN3424_c0_g1_i1.p1  ORF type:complete len:139 (+),score=5.54 TRINITY_DN3424_c0_g1_i1:76-492(+)
MINILKALGVCLVTMTLCLLFRSLARRQFRWAMLAGISQFFLTTTWSGYLVTQYAYSFYILFLLLLEKRNREFEMLSFILFYGVPKILSIGLFRSQGLFPIGHLEQFPDFFIFVASSLLYLARRFNIASKLYLYQSSS